jgi:hypothetical protein
MRDTNTLECSKPHIAPQNSALERRRRLARIQPGAQTPTRAGRSRSVANSAGDAAPLSPPNSSPHNNALIDLLCYTDITSDNRALTEGGRLCQQSIRRRSTWM